MRLQGPTAGLRWRGARRTSPAHRIDCRVLLVAAARDEPELDVWRGALVRAGIPFEVHVARGRPPISADMLAHRDHARYQAVIIVAGGLPCRTDSGYVSTMSAAGWAALADFERRFAIRRITGFAYPSPQHGLDAPTAAGVVCGSTAELTAAGRRVFAELRDSVALDPAAYGYRARPLGANFQTLVAHPDGSALVGVLTRPEDGREDMICTLAASPHAIHFQLLFDGMLRWATRGVHLGHRRRYLSVHVDDVFLADDSWDRDSCTTVPKALRMKPEDVVAAVAWSRRHDLRLTMAFNAHGASAEDELTTSLLRHKDAFTWINHTFGHLTLDDLDRPALIAEIRRNVDFARAHGLAIDPVELVTGAHSGLRNPQMPAALRRTGIRWIADDSSRRPAQQRLAGALTVPRHPTNIYFNTATRVDQLHQYDHRLSTTSSPAHAAPLARRRTTWKEFVAREADTMLRHVLGNDPRPHYLHQSNLSGERIAYGVLEEVLARFHEHLTVALTQPTLAQVGEELACRASWRRALRTGAVSAYLHDGRLHVRSQVALRVPVTGTQEVGDEHGGDRSGWSAPIDAADRDVGFTVA